MSLGGDVSGRMCSGGYRPAQRVEFKMLGFPGSPHSIQQFHSWGHNLKMLFRPALGSCAYGAELESKPSTRRWREDQEKA